MFYDRVLQMGSTRRMLYLLLGHMMVVLGTLGIVLPVMPTTVFFIAAAWFYARSSPRLQRWLLHNRVFGSYVRDFVEKRGISLSTKVSTIGLLWLTLGISQAFLESGSWVRPILGAVGISVSVHLACLKLKQPKH